MDFSSQVDLMPSVGLITSTRFRYVDPSNSLAWVSLILVGCPSYWLWRIRSDPFCPWSCLDMEITKDEQQAFATSTMLPGSLVGRFDSP
jgi:hypothetical protein